MSNYSQGGTIPEGKLAIVGEQTQGPEIITLTYEGWIAYRYCNYYPTLQSHQTLIMPDENAMREEEKRRMSTGEWKPPIEILKWIREEEQTI